jgi:hypothetical protein
MPAPALLSGKAPSCAERRRAHLRAYLLACIDDNILSPVDLININSTAQKLLRTITADLRGEAVQLGQSAGANLLQWIGRGLAKKLG